MLSFRFGAWLSAGLLSFGITACSPSINPALKAKVDQRVQTAPLDASYDPPSAPQPLPLSPGQWATYKLLDSDQRPSILTYKVVGQEGDAFWLELVNESYTSHDVTLMLADLGDRKSPKSMQVMAFKQKHDDGAVQETPKEMLGLSRTLYMPILQSFRASWEDRPQEDVQVPAGTFASCYKAEVTVSLLGMTRRTMTWMHSSVPVNGMVRSKGLDDGTTVELLEFGLEGAESEIGI